MSKKAFTTKIEETLIEQLKENAETLNVSISSLVEQALKRQAEYVEYIAKNKLLHNMTLEHEGNTMNIHDYLQARCAEFKVGFLGEIEERVTTENHPAKGNIDL
jgi:uncharacterized protein (UPF0305 family)